MSPSQRLAAYQFPLSYMIQKSKISICGHKQNQCEKHGQDCLGEVFRRRPVIRWCVDSFVSSVIVFALLHVNC